MMNCRGKQERENIDVVLVDVNNKDIKLVPSRENLCVLLGKY